MYTHLDQTYLPQMLTHNSQDCSKEYIYFQNFPGALKLALTPHCGRPRNVHVHTLLNFRQLNFSRKGAKINTER